MTISGGKQCRGDGGARKEKNLQVKIMRVLVPAIVTLSTPCFISPPDSAASLGQPVEILRGAALFERSCIGCHDKGGNLLQPGATLFARDLEKNKVATQEELYDITYYGKGRMPGFGEKCTPRGQCTFGPRLKDEEIELLASFVKLQADNGWPSIESGGD